jgi:MoxR-like ATPase
MIISKILSKALDADLPIFFWGPPGIGKSAIIRQEAANRGWTEENGSFIDIRLTQLEPVDLRGLPIPHLEKGRTEWLPPVWLPYLESDRPETGLLFLDEASSAPPSVQAAAYQLVLDRKLGESTMKKGWRLVLAGNRVSDGGVAFRLAMPLANRMLHFVQEYPVLDQWTTWAFQNELDPLIIGFLQFRPKLFFTFPEALKAKENAYATPRSWEMVSKLLKSDIYDLSSDELSILIAGAVGESIAIEFVAWVRLKDKLPNLDKILNDQNVPILSQKEIDKGYACAVALAERIISQGKKDKTKAQKWSQHAIKWLESCNPSFTALFINIVRAKNQSLLAGSVHSDWVEKHRDILV